MASGCPVALSNRGSLPEVGGSAAWYFDPDDVEQLEHLVISALRDASAREDMRARGLQRATEFSWSKTALATKRVYDRLLQ